MKFLDTEISPLGLGCWPIGGAMFSATGETLGYANTDDKQSIRAIHAAVANGITLFDTAAAYGAGHSERLLARALSDNAEVQIVTKIGIAIDEASKQLCGDEVLPEQVLPAIERCCSRLQRETIDLLLLHQNSLPVDQAAPLFEEMEKARKAGKIKSYGWSTDFTASVQAMTDRPGFVAVEHAMNVLCDAPRIQRALQRSNTYALIRSPLAMGLLSGKYTPTEAMQADDIRSTSQMWLQYFRNGKPNREYLERFNAVRELLQTDGRTAVQGALGWLWAKGESNIPIPGARTVHQVEGLAAALEFGALPPAVMEEIDRLVDHNNDQPDHER